MIVLQSCQQGRSSEPALDTRTPYTLKDIAYGQDSAQRLDVYLPANRSRQSTPVMVLVHGGGWSGGNKSDFNSYIESFRKRMPGYAFVNINYRLVNGNTLLPQQETDVQSAIDFVKAQAGKYDFQPGKMVLLGASAGAHLALLHAYKHPDTSVRAVIDFFGPADLQAMAEKPWHPLVPLALQMIIGRTYHEAPAVYRSASPAYHVGPKAPPTLILHGALDNVVAPSQSRSLAEKLTEAGIANELVIYPGQRHGWYGKTLEKSFDKMEAFLGKHVD